MNFEFTGPPSAVIATPPGATHYTPTPGDGSLATISERSRTEVVTAGINAEPLPERAEQGFEKVPLFTIDPEETCTEIYDRVYSLPYLNWMLRRAALAAVDRPDNGHAARNGKRGGPDDDATNIFQGLGVEEIAKKINYMGYQVAGLGSNVPERTQGVRLGRYRRLTAQLQGEIDHVPNIFRPQVTYVRTADGGSIRDITPALRQGDMVGFMVKRIAWKDGRTNAMGDALDDVGQKPPTVVQVLGVAGANGCLPMGDTGDEDTQGDTYDMRNGRRVPVPAIFIPVGQVVRVTPHVPPPELQYRASYTHYGYELLKTRLMTVDIQLSSRHPQRWAV